MVCFSDAFLFTLISVEESVGIKARNALRDEPVFRFLKTLRNVTTHHSVLASSAPGSKFPRPFTRHVTDLVGGPVELSSARLCFRFDVLGPVFDAVETERPWEKGALDQA